MIISLPQQIYTVAWILACGVCLYFWLSRREICFLRQREYWRFLARPWKLGTFAMATLFMVLIAPYSGDYTWDWVDGLYMSALTYMTAPWAVGIFFRFIRRRARLRQVFIAFCLWMFSASWSYDIYLLIRDGVYPLTWQANLMASSILYWSAGTFWSLDWNPVKGVHYSFAEDNWFKTHQGPVFLKILRRGWMFILVAGIILVGVVVMLNMQ